MLSLLLYRSVFMWRRPQQTETLSEIASENCSMQIYVNKLKEENQYFKKALKTGESLIQAYQEENNNLSKQVQDLKKKIKQKQQQNETILKMFHLQEEKKILKNAECEKEQNMLKMEKRIQELVKSQQKYEQKISQMENRIEILQKGQRNHTMEYDSTSGVSIQNCQHYSVSTGLQSVKKLKNLNDLRMFHLKLKNIETPISQNIQKPITQNFRTISVISRQKSNKKHMTTPSKKKQTNNSLSKYKR